MVVADNSGIGGPPKGASAAVRAKPHAQVAKPTSRRARKLTPKRQSARAGSKTAKILALLRRPTGASLAELTKTTGWQVKRDAKVRLALSGDAHKPLESC